ncbi:hypothetical protein EXE10_06980 [Acinetobacter sp. WCHAc060033]|uniref:Ig-like domain-containing protein n=1 Tax=Acinetobacter sp. WCHAc060033 TaxID=2518624 RepID=UPI001022BBC4|nr:Ig-like domain-containing protein [Acinetobacter sp. WCHAc060033]RZG86342.1 hypothetical protein EXE10_06980 [Acinetobacter sp. WCHAc060033]
MDTRKFTGKLSAIAISILLASCGGGDGYYGKSDSSTETGGETTGGETTKVVVDSLKIELSKLSMAASNDTLTVTVRALDNNKGGLADSDIILSVVDSSGNVQIQGVSKVTTDENGNAVFVLTTPSTSSNLQTLIENGFSIKAQTNNGQLTQQQTIAVTGDKTSTTDTTSIVLFNATKASLNVRSDLTTLTLTAVDANGAVLPNQAISLKVNDVAKNGVKYVPQATQTDANGQITYTLIISESARNSSYSATQFIQDGLNLEANFGQSSTIYKYKINIVNSTVPTPVGAINVAYNPTKIQDSATGVYYYQNVSVQVNDVDGKPLPNTEVTMGVNPLSYIKGGYSFDIVDGEKKYVYHPTASCTNPTKVVNSNGVSVNQLDPVNGQTVQVVSYIKNENEPATNNKYTTDPNGRFDLMIQYPKMFGSWLNVQLSATSTVNSSTITGTTSLLLPYLGTDVDTTAENGPNMRSPFGTSFNCADGN